METNPKPNILITYCPGCRWLLRAAWMAQELLSTFEDELGGVTLTPSEVGGVFRIETDSQVFWDRAVHNGFPEIKELKKRVRDSLNPDRHLGHLDR